MKIERLLLLFPFVSIIFIFMIGVFRKFSWSAPDWVIDADYVLVDV